MKHTNDHAYEVTFWDAGHARQVGRSCGSAPAHAAFCLILMAAFLLSASLVLAGEVGQPRTLAGWYSVTSPEGWTGRSFTDNRQIFAEEFDTNRDNAMDVWRFYRSGVLSSEERDLNFDGRVDYQSKWDTKSGTLMGVTRDTESAGINDLEIERLARNRWLIREDRNKDGVADRILTVVGPPNLFDRLEIDLTRERSVIDKIPTEYWAEVELDNGYSGNISERYRYSRGRPVERGISDGKRVVWRRYRPDDPASSAPPAVAARNAAAPATASPTGSGGFAEPSTATFPTDVNDPFSAPSFGAGDPTYTEPSALGSGEPFPTAPTPGFEPPTPSGGDLVTPSIPLPASRDRRRYDGLPPGDSAARSLPLPMRPPGQ